MLLCSYVELGSVMIVNIPYSLWFALKRMPKVRIFLRKRTRGSLYSLDTSMRPSAETAVFVGAARAGRKLIICYNANSTDRP